MTLLKIFTSQKPYWSLDTANISIPSESNSRRVKHSVGLSDCSYLKHLSA